jgi:signal transduction histidine kinase/AmiR/NasT family two-component response regulator
MLADDYIETDRRKAFLRSTALGTLTSALSEKVLYVVAYDHFTASSADAPLKKQILFSWMNEEKREILCIQQDVTAAYRKEQEQMLLLEKEKRAAEAANAAKSQFLSRMSHDIRTPLNGIIGMTYLAQEQQNPARTADCLSKIDTSSKFLLSLINDVLDMAKAESGKIELHPEPYPVDEFADYMSSIIAPLCQERNQTFLFEPAEILTDVIPLLDKLRINQVVFNLLSNAVKYTPEGGTIRYRVVERRLGAGRMSMHFEISDNGIGMSEKFQKVLFDPFTQENGGESLEMRGSGLGLAITKRLIDALGGTVKVASQLGKGTTFTVDFVLDCVQAEREEISEPIGNGVGESIKGCHVLLCEDHPLNQEIAKAILTEQGLLVDVASDGAQGIKTFENSSFGFFDCILMDIRMPVLNGYDAAQVIRSLNRPDAKSVPILAMTADAFADDVQRCLDVGMNGHIAKPIDPKRLNQTLTDVIFAAKSRRLLP